MMCRVYALAKSGGVASKNMAALLQVTGHFIKSPSSNVELLPLEREAYITTAGRLFLSQSPYAR